MPHVFQRAKQGTSQWTLSSHCYFYTYHVRPTNLKGVQASLIRVVSTRAGRHTVTAESCAEEQTGRNHEPWFLPETLSSATACRNLAALRINQGQAGPCVTSAEYFRALSSPQSKVRCKEQVRGCHMHLQLNIKTASLVSLPMWGCLPSYEPDI